MIRPSPQPDELVQSYWGRVIRWNGWDNDRNALTILRRQQENADLGSREEPLIKLIAEIAGMSTERFAQNHTTLPLRRGITSYQTKLEHGASNNLDMLWSTSMRVGRPGAYFCPDCVAADIERQGFSYWRRSLQIPGLYQCPTHSTALHLIESNKAFGLPPEDFLGAGIQIPHNLIRKEQTNPVIKCYLMLAQAFLDRPKPLAVRPIGINFKKKAAELGLQTYIGKVKYALLSDLVISKFGREWLQAVMPKLAVKPEGTIFHSIDGVLYFSTSSSTSVAYLLAASALFETYDQAMLALESNNVDDQVGSNRKSIPIDENELLKNYAATGGNYRATTERFPKINDFVVRKRLQALGLPNFGGRSHPNLLLAASAFYLEQKSLNEAATLFGVPLLQLEHLVRNVGVNMTLVLKMIAQGGEPRNFTMTKQNLPIACFTN